MVKVKISLREVEGILKFRNKICVSDDDKLNLMDYLRVMKENSFYI